VTPERFWLAAALFHLVVLLGLVRVARRFWSSEACGRPTAAWLPALAADLAGLAVFAYLAAFLAPVVTNTDSLRELALGEISVRLWGQALFAEGVLLCGCLALRHCRASQLVRAGALGLLGLGLLAVYVRAYRMEPRMLRVRHHELERVAGGAVGTRDLRILHLTDIQTPTIGAHERRALEAGLAARPDLIVLTGDYVQNELGRRTEERAAFDLRVLMSRVGFNAPLGVFATNGDAGPPCRDVFAGTAVRCLVDESASVALPGGGTMSITGLSRSRGRERRPEALGELLGAVPRADVRVVISHAPDFVDALPEPVDLVLAGHTHGGQVVLPFFGPPHTASRLPRLYAGGLHDYAGTPLHVSRGVGMERGFAPPLRFLCPPEICVLDVHLRAGHARVAHAGEGRGLSARYRASLGFLGATTRAEAWKRETESPSTRRPLGE
jgi:predicted MPP superfamily phosphohydrolase